MELLDITTSEGSKASAPSSSGAARKTSDAEELINSHTTQQRVGGGVQQGTKQPEGTGKPPCQSMWVTNWIGKALAVREGVNSCWLNMEQLMAARYDTLEEACAAAS